MKTIAQQLNVTEFPLTIKDKNGKEIYYEGVDGYWEKREHDSNGNTSYFINSDDCWYKAKYDSDGNKLYFEDSDGYWFKKEYDSNGNLTYYENSKGEVEDYRPKTELSMQEIADKFGIKVEQLKIKK